MYNIYHIKKNTVEVYYYCFSEFLCFLFNKFFFFSDGFVVVACEEPVTARATGQLLLDYLTDSVISHKPALFGRPHVAPDSRVVVTLDRASDGVTLVVQEVTGQ